LAKIKTVFKSFNVNVVKDNGLLRVLLNQDLITISIHLVLDVVKQPSYIMTISFIHTSLVVTRDVIIISLCLSWVEIPNTSSSSIDLEKFTIKRMRHPFHIVFTALTLYFFDNSTLRKISQHLELVCEVKVSHVTVSNWCKRFAPALLNAASPYKKQLSLSESDEWHFDETYIKINGKDYYVWFALDFETRVILDSISLSIEILLLLIFC